MNADSADTRYPHLDLDNLIAVAAGQAVSDRTQEHLASCEHCQREANRWNVVAGGIRSLAADAPEAAERARQRTQRHGPTPAWRRAMLAAGSAAAALVLFVGVGELAGVVHVSLSGPGSDTVLTAVTGCSQLKQADGTLEQVNGTSLVIKTAAGQPVTVTTTATTFVSMSGALLSDITDGASVMVRGSMSDGTIQAAIVTVGEPFSAVNPAGFVPVQGTVSDTSTAGFTLVTSGGTRIPVATSSDTLVVMPHASPGQLEVGGTIFAVGQTGPDGTLSARAVAAVSPLPSGVLHTSVRVKDCSPSSIQDALGAISARPLSSG
jgi:Domain of unknown function (DUF5666)